MTDPLDRVRAVLAAPQDVVLPPGLAPHPVGEGPRSDDAASGDAAPDDAASDDAGDLPPLDAYVDALEPPPPGGDVPDDPARLCAAMAMNDLGNGQRLAAHFGADMIYVGQIGWHVWQQDRWKADAEIAKDTSPAVRRLAHRIGPLIETETRYIEPSARDRRLIGERKVLSKRQSDLWGLAEADRAGDHSDELGRIEVRQRRIAALLVDHQTTIARRLTHAKNAGNAGPLSNMIREASVMLSREVDELDVGLMDVNTQSGVLRFSVQGGGDTGFSKVARVDLIAHARDQLMTKIMPVLYDPAAECPIYDAFLARIQPDPAMRAFLHRWFGLALTGLTGEQKMAVFYGAGANGKSVLVELIARLMGDYAATAKIESLTGKNRRGGGDATPDLMPLIGARFVRASEPEEGERLQEATIKQLTGGETIMARSLNANFIEFNPLFKLTITSNHKPEIRGTDDGIWRRVMLVLFNVQIPKLERDAGLGARLWAERAGILNRVVAGLLDYLEGGLQEPQDVLAATKEFREESDPVGAFLEACCVVTGDARDTIPSRQLGDAFNFWLGDRGEGSWSPQWVARRLKDKAGRWTSPTTGRSFTARKSSTMKYEGIRLNDIFGPLFRDAPRDHKGNILWQVGTTDYSAGGSAPSEFDL